jgi:hypothetical protein
MIPRYLQGQSAAKILTTIEARGEPLEFYKMMLLIAIKDALCAADDSGIGDDSRGAEAEGRGIAFLNLVVPSP